MAHELGKEWTSRWGRNLGSIADDVLGKLDLSNMSAGGDAADCVRKPSNKRISGVTDPLTIQEAPNAKYLVRIDQMDPVEIHYRGIAILNPATNKITKIVGTVRAPFLPLTKEDLEGEGARRKTAFAQEEGTWIATQP